MNFTHEPKSHACKGVDEWLSVQGSAPSKERNPGKREATTVRWWSFTRICTDLLRIYTDKKIHICVYPLISVCIRVKYIEE
jgi:hypothetical protein